MLSDSLHTTFLAKIDRLTYHGWHKPSFITEYIHFCNIKLKPKFLASSTPSSLDLNCLD